MFGVALPSNHSILYPLSSSQPLFSGISGGDVCYVAANQRLVISWVHLIFCNRTCEQGGSILPSNFFTEVVVLVLYFWRKISSLASSTFEHFFLPYIKHVHSLNRTIIRAVIVGFDTDIIEHLLKLHIFSQYLQCFDLTSSPKRGRVITCSKCVITREWLTKCFTQCNVKLVQEDESLKISWLHTCFNPYIDIFIQFFHCW